MVYVRMLTDMTGGRHDGRDWPGYMKTIDVEKWEAEHLVNAKIAEYPDVPELDRRYDVLKAPDPDYESKLRRLDGEEDEEELREVHPAPVDDSEDFDRGDDDFERDVPEPVKHTMKRPVTVDAKARWIEWAVYNGANENNAKAQTKAQLIAEYGTL